MGHAEPKIDFGFLLIIPKKNWVFDRFFLGNAYICPKLGNAITQNFLQCSTLAPALCFFIDTAFHLGIFPRSLKIAKITPLFKSGKTNELTNYRLISILSCFSKIFEKLIQKRLTNFFAKHSVLSKSQYGFQNNTSTSDVILEVGLLISSNEHINSQLYTGLVLLDFKKAFDTVCHSVLLSKLEHYGIRGEALKLLGSYLTDREQYVAFQNAHSYAVINHYEVFQGSTLGPLLFLICINDLQNSLNSSPILFADDIQYMPCNPWFQSKWTTHINKS